MLNERVLTDAIAHFEKAHPGHACLDCLRDVMDMALAADRLALIEQIKALPRHWIELPSQGPINDGPLTISTVNVDAVLALPGLAPTSEQPE